MFYQCNTKSISKLFSFSECDVILEMVSNSKLSQAKVAGKIDTRIRNCQLLWIPETSETQWIFKRINDCFNEVNNEYYQFELSKLEDIQYLRYERFNFFTPHFDIGAPEIASRKLAISVQLSNSSDYLGGNLTVRDIAGETKAPRGKGDAIIFPTYLLHRAYPIWYGTRHCMIAWAHGKVPFK